MRFESTIAGKTVILEQERYATEAEAEEGHARHVAKLERDLED